LIGWLKMMSESTSASSCGGLLLNESSGLFIVPRTSMNASMPEISRRARRLSSGSISSAPEKPMRPSRRMSKRRPWKA
jgi:hypothetical protein